MKRTSEFNFYNLLSAVQYDDVYGKMGIYLNIANNIG